MAGISTPRRPQPLLCGPNTFPRALTKELNTLQHSSPRRSPEVRLSRPATYLLLHLLGAAILPRTGFASAASRFALPPRRRAPPLWAWLRLSGPGSDRAGVCGLGFREHVSGKVLGLQCTHHVNFVLTYHILWCTVGTGPSSHTTPATEAKRGYPH